MAHIGLGISLWSQQTDWPAYLSAAKRVDEQGYDHLWTWDHLLSAIGDPGQPVLEGYASLAATAAATKHVRLGLLVSANTFRNPAMLAKTITTIDHISGGRAILGLGGAWHEREHEAYGIDFGRGTGERLQWLDEALSIIRPLLAGEEVTHSGPRYQTNHLRLLPRPLQAHVPIMVGGIGEKKTLLTVARYADMWNAIVPFREARHKIEVLAQHCEAIGRDPASIELTLNCTIVIRDRETEARALLRDQFIRNHTTVEEIGDDGIWAGTPEQIADYVRAYQKLGFQTLTCTLPAPYDHETIDRLIQEVRPLVEHD